MPPRLIVESDRPLKTNQIPHVRTSVLGDATIDRVERGNTLDPLADRLQRAVQDTGRAEDKQGGRTLLELLRQDPGPESE